MVLDHFSSGAKTVSGNSKIRYNDKHLYANQRSDEIHIRWSDKTTHLHVDASSSLQTLLNGDNYQSCAKLAAIALIRKGNIRLVNGEITAPKDTISARPASPIENIL